VLVIRDAQLAKLQSQPRRNVELQFVRILFQHYPQECLSAGEARIQAFVKRGIRNAASHGYLSIDAIGLYITLMMILGSEFDSDPQLDWAQVQLDDFSRPPSERIRALFQITLQYLDNTAGGACQHLVRAMLRIRKYDFETPLNLTAEELNDKLAADLALFYPEKAVSQGDLVNQALIQRASEHAAESGIVGPNGVAIWVTLAFMLGIGFYVDPIFWWASEALSETRKFDEKERVARLLTRACEHLDASLRMSGDHH